MPRLREMNANLDNQIKKMNDKIKAAAKVSKKSSTYVNIRKAMKGIAKLTGQELKTVNVNGVEVPQLSRASKYYSNTASLPSVEARANYAGKQSIEKEMKNYSTKSSTSYSKSKDFKNQFVQSVDKNSFTSNLNETTLYGAAMSYAKSMGWDIESMIQYAVYSDHYAEEWWITSVEEMVKKAKEEVDKAEEKLRRFTENGKAGSPEYQQAEEEYMKHKYGYESLEAYQKSLEIRYSGV